MGANRERFIYYMTISLTCRAVSMLFHMGEYAVALCHCLGHISCMNAVQDMISLLLCDTVQQKLPLSYVRIVIVALQSSTKWHLPKLQFIFMAFLLVYDPLCQTSAMKFNCKWWAKEDYSAQCKRRPKWEARDQ